MKQNVILQQLQLLYLRFILKSPKGFAIFTNIMLVISIITGLPEFLAMFDIQLPPQLSIFESKLVATAAAVAAFIGKVTVADAAQLNKSSNQKQDNEKAI